MLKRTYHIITYGCQMNEHDSEAMAGILENMGYEKSPDEKADFILINTCCVRENAAQRLYGHVASLKRIKKENPQSRIGICGCLPQQPGELDELRQKLSHVDLVFGTHNLPRLPEFLARLDENGPPVYEIEESSGHSREEIPIRRGSDLKAWVTIMYGCNNFCSYCIVPFVRGREKSRKASDILHEIADLAQNGTKEITLLGQNVNSYGKDHSDHPDFAELLAAVNGVPGVERIRFQTSHPRDVTGRLIRVMAEASKVCEHLHLPLQAGSDAILARMNRGYDSHHYLDIVKQLRQAIPDMSLTTDLIVGFPGESDRDFQATLDIVKQVEFDAAFTFAYSPRRGTPASAMEDQISNEVKQERLQRLIDLQNGISLSRNRSETGRVRQVMVEGPSQRDPAVWVGRTRTNKLVHFPHTPVLVRGLLTDIRITEGQTHTLYGQVADGDPN